MAFIGDDKGDTYGRTHNYSNKPVYSTPAAPAQQSQQQQGQSQQQQQRYEYQDYLDQMAEAQRQQQEAYAKAMEERAAALVKWQQEQVALREAQQREQQSRKPWYRGAGLSRDVGGAENSIAGKGSVWNNFLSGVQGAQNFMNPQLNIGGSGASQYDLPFSMSIAPYDLGTPSYAPGKPAYWSEGNPDFANNIPRPYTPTNAMVTNLPPEGGEPTWGGGGEEELPPFPIGGWGGGGWGGYNYPSYDYTPAEQKPYYKNQVGGINWRI